MQLHLEERGPFSSLLKGTMSGVEVTYMGVSKELSVFHVLSWMVLHNWPCYLHFVSEHMKNTIFKYNMHTYIKYT